MIQHSLFIDTKIIKFFYQINYKILNYSYKIINPPCIINLSRKS